jgi:hypothetical protein
MAKKSTSHRSAPSIIQMSTSGNAGQTKTYTAAEVIVEKDLESFLGIRTDEEIKSLEENILKKGIEKPLDVWMNQGRRVVVDGFTRLRIAKKHGLPFRITLREFSDKEEAKFWMIANQTDRRNLTTLHNAYLIGYEYNQLKKDGRANLLQYITPGSHNETSVQTSGNQAISKKANKSSPESHNETSVVVNDSGDLLAAKHNTARATIMRYSLVYQALTAIQNHSMEFYHDIIREKVNVTAKDLEAYTKLESKPVVTDEVSLKNAIAEKDKKQSNPKREAARFSTLIADTISKWKKYERKASPKNRTLVLTGLQKLQTQVEAEIKRIELEIND